MASAKEIKAMNASASVAGGSSSKSNESEADFKNIMDEIKRLRLENDEFKKRQRPVTFAVNEKGGVAVHGVGKFPVNLYKIQWERILEKADELKVFIEENKDNLN